MKKNILFFILGLIIAGSIGVYATIKIQASEIEYNNTPLDEVLDDLYNNGINSEHLVMENNNSFITAYPATYIKNYQYFNIIVTSNDGASCSIEYYRSPNTILNSNTDYEISIYDKLKLKKNNSSGWCDFKINYHN